MKLLTLPVMAFSLLTLGFAQAGHTQVSPGDRPQTVEITRNGSQPSTEGSADSFTGSVRINPLFAAHIASQEALNGSPVDWLKQVSDKQYQAPNINQ